MAAVFLVAAGMNVLVVMLALFVLRPIRHAPPPNGRRHRLTRGPPSATSVPTGAAGHWVEECASPPAASRSAAWCLA